MSLRRRRGRLSSLLDYLRIRPTRKTIPASQLRLVQSVPLHLVVSRDRIVRGLLRAGVVSDQEIFTAWAHQQDFRDARPLWRIISDVQGTNTTGILRVAARAYSFKEANVSVVGTKTLVAQNRTLFTEADWRRMVELGVFPVREKNDTLEGGVKWTFASYDPSRVAVRSFTESVARGSVALRFVNPLTLFDVLDKCTGFSKLHALPWYRKYVLGRLPIALRPLPATERLRRVA